MVLMPEVRAKIHKASRRKYRRKIFLTLWRQSLRKKKIKYQSSELQNKKLVRLDLDQNLKLCFKGHLKKVK
jgi:hypothetical protein